MPNIEPLLCMSNENFPAVDTPTPCHLIVLSHGLWGTQTHFSYVEENLINTLQLKHPNKTFRSYKTKSNEKFKTYDGIDLCGARVAEEIFQETARLLQKQNLQVTQLSYIGYSLGGLIARFAIGVLDYKGFFDSVEAVNFVTFCTPHVGVLTPGTSISIKAFNGLVPYLLGNSGKQIFLKDSVNIENSNNRVPLLKLMASENSVFFQGLKRFKNHALYSNIRSDIRTSWWTSGISYINPFEILDRNPNVSIDNNGFIRFSNGSKFELSFLENYDPILLDVEKPIKFTGLIDYDTEKNIKKIKNKKVEFVENSNKFHTFFINKFKCIVMFWNSFIYFPMWVSWFILFNILQVFTSSFRVNRESSRLKEHSCVYSLIDQFSNTMSKAVPIQSASTTPLLKPTLSRTLSEGYSNELDKLENDLRDQGDFFLDSVFDAVTSSNHPDQSIFNQQAGGDITLTTSINKICSIAIDQIGDWETDYRKLGNSKKEAFEYYQILKSFKMNMSPIQQEIIGNLNKLNWKKYPVYITKTNSTHAAAIVRHQDPNFEEGKIVVEHFCEEAFKVY